jgi:parallel beta-helix repeat protein
MKKIVLLAFVLVLLWPMTVFAYFRVPVEAELKIIYVDSKNTGFEDGSKEYPYNTIKEGINAAGTGYTVFVYNGTYQEWDIVISKDNFSLVGENRSSTVIDGMDLGWILKIAAQNVTVAGFTIRRSSRGTAGVFLYHATKSRISNNIIINHDSGIYAEYSNGNVIENNWVADNNEGIILSSVCKENTITGNRVTGNTLFAGIDLSNGAHNNEIKNNNITQNRYGILITFENNSISGNYIINNSVGIYEYSESTHGYRIFHNNFINNKKQVDLGNLSVNGWDDGVEGNYWSDYNGTDFNKDGIGDTQYIISGNNTDHNPLMGIFQSYNISSGYYVNVISNSTIKNFEHFESNSTIKMYISNSSVTQTYGFCRVCIPHALMNPDEITVIIDDGQTPVAYHNYTLHDDGTHRWIYFAYEHSTHEVLIGDTKPPSLSILSPQNTTYTVDDVPLTFTVSEPTSWIGYNLDSQTNVTVAENTTLCGLSQGLHNLIVLAKDTAGNIGASEMIYFTIETQQDETFQILIVAAIVTISVVVAFLLVYFAKIKKTNENGK